MQKSPTDEDDAAEIVRVRASVGNYLHVQGKDFGNLGVRQAGAIGKQVLPDLGRIPERSWDLLDGLTGTRGLRPYTPSLPSALFGRP